MHLNRQIEKLLPQNDLLPASHFFMNFQSYMEMWKVIVTSHRVIKIALLHFLRIFSCIIFTNGY